LKGFLGEFAAANALMGDGQIGAEAITNMLTFVGTNAAVWLGWTWWSAGPWWQDYMFTLEPQNLGQTNEIDRPALSVIRSFIPIPAPLITLVQGNQFQFFAQRGFSYQPQFSTNIAIGGWSDFGPLVVGDGKLATSSLGEIGSNQAYYRIEISRQP
jgi:hypothetical protein